MFPCRAALQKLAPLARQTVTHIYRNGVPMRQMSSGVPGGSGDNVLYVILCSGCVVVAGIYGYKTVSLDKARYNDRITEIQARPKEAWVPKPWPPKGDDESEEAEEAPEGVGEESVAEGTTELEAIEAEVESLVAAVEVAVEAEPVLETATADTVAVETALAEAIEDEEAAPSADENNDVSSSAIATGEIPSVPDLLSETVVRQQAKENVENAISEASEEIKFAEDSPQQKYAMQSFHGSDIPERLAAASVSSAEIQLVHSEGPEVSMESSKEVSAMDTANEQLDANAEVESSSPMEAVVAQPIKMEEDVETPTAAMLTPDEQISIELTTEAKLSPVVEIEKSVIQVEEAPVEGILAESTTEVELNPIVESVVEDEESLEEKTVVVVVDSHKVEASSVEESPLETAVESELSPVAEIVHSVNEVEATPVGRIELEAQETPMVEAVVEVEATPTEEMSGQSTVEDKFTPLYSKADPIEELVPEAKVVAEVAPLTVDVPAQEDAIKTEALKMPTREYIVVVLEGAPKKSKTPKVLAVGPVKGSVIPSGGGSISTTVAERPEPHAASANTLLANKSTADDTERGQ